MQEASAVIRGDGGRIVGTFTVAQLAGRSHRLDLDDERIVLEEEATYLFQVHPADDVELVRLSPGTELFSFDDSSCLRGRLQPRRHVGRIKVVMAADELSGSVTFSVQPTKLRAESEYRHMLSGIAEIATEALLQGFAPSALALAPDVETRPELLYQQFALLHARLMGSGQHDIARVLHRPHTEWREQEELQLPGTPLNGGSKAIRALGRPGVRLRMPPGSAFPSIPQRVASLRTEETFDTAPNQLVVFALKRWRELAQRVLNALDKAAHVSGPATRGVDAAREVMALVDQTLAAPQLNNISPMRSFPSGNQVLQKRAGYRELFRTFVLSELGARLSLDWDLNDAFGASQRNVATLYEYWAFLQLARIVGSVCGKDLTTSSFVATNDGMSLGFPQGNRSRLRWDIVARGRPLSVELYFNRDFRASSRPDSSWSRAMRPDCSIRVSPLHPTGGVPSADLAVWLHFDAKYKLEYAKEQFARSADESDVAARAEASERLGQSKRQDLLKMHAYRDAIRRSAGAYVLFPGDDPQTPFRQQGEVLPSLGAFPLRPTSDGAAGSAELQTFLENAVEHAADQATQHERSRYWTSVIHRRPPTVRSTDRRLPALTSPPSDAPVLCGYIRSLAHRDWIYSTHFYNVRAGERRGAVSADAEVLRAPDLVLYGPSLSSSLWSRVGPWFVQTKEELDILKYPHARGNVYLCCSLDRRDDEPEWLSSVDIGSLSAGVVGLPFATSWQDLLDAAG